MWRNNNPRPSFLLRSLMIDMRVAHTAYSSEQDRFYMQPSSVDATWEALEPLLVPLTLAGWECSEILLSAPHFGDSSGTRDSLRVKWDGTCSVDPGDWRDLTGLHIDLTSIFQVVALRVTVRRSFGQPSKQPAIDLPASPNYVKQLDATDPFADPRDGWWVFTTNIGGLTEQIVPLMLPQAQAALVDALASAWDDQAHAKPVGLLRSFDPLSWQSPLDRAAWVWPFDDLAGELWNWLQPNMRAFLALPLDDKAASLAGLIAKSGARTNLHDAIAALEERRAVLRGRDANLPQNLARLRHRHWALALFLLHEYGLIRVLPFPLEYQQAIPFVDVTGYYESVKAYESSGRLIIATLQLNQAGDHVEGCFFDDQLQRTDLSAGPPKLQSDGTVSMTFIVVGATSSGSLLGIPSQDESTQDFTLWVSLHSVRYQFIRRDRLARSSPLDILAALGTAAPANLSDHLPRLHPLSEQGIKGAAARLAMDIDNAALHLETDWATYLLPTADALIKILDKGGVLRFTGSVASRTPVNTPMLARFRSMIPLLLMQTQLQNTGGLNAWSKLLSMFARHPGRTTKLQSLLNAAPSPPHEYSYQIAGIGLAGEFRAIPLVGPYTAGLGMGSFAIGCRIEHLGKCAPTGIDSTTHGWTEWYSGWMAQGSAGIAMGAELEISVFTIGSPNDLFATTEWTQSNFVPCFFCSVGVADNITVGLGPGLSFAPNTSVEAYVFINAQGALGLGWSDGWSLSAGAGVGFAVGISGSLTVGTLSREWGSPLLTPPPPPPPFTIPAVYYNLSTTESFATGTCELSQAAKDHLKIYVARYRAVLENPETVITVLGDASRTGTEAYNLSLSWRRALAIYAYVRSLLTTTSSGDWTNESNALGSLDSRVVLFAFGEERAKADHKPDGVEDSQWRRAQLLINGQIMVVL